MKYLIGKSKIRSFPIIDIREKNSQIIIRYLFAEDSYGTKR